MSEFSKVNKRKMLIFKGFTAHFRPNIFNMDTPNLSFADIEHHSQRDLKSRRQLILRESVSFAKHYKREYELLLEKTKDLRDYILTTNQNDLDAVHILTLLGFGYSGMDNPESSRPKPPLPAVRRSPLDNIVISATGDLKARIIAWLPGDPKPRIIAEGNEEGLLQYMDELKDDLKLSEVAPQGAHVKYLLRTYDQNSSFDSKIFYGQ